ncbi:NAD/NADP-dependent octopine/nopaline dehydrogenase family protein [Pectobacterium versatile]|uniref:NAD/NADP-dependent octopine/nopaline dehydrogenase family protein n=1 Tax=Pectobacterium versatile TaxID=2488639 RepID=UPI001CCDC847|nr:NAD/NADP octopine/nopaline dehydrogenase family protein [Pectobacterium versatile]
MNITILGAGNSGLGMAAHICYLGHSVRLWNRSPQRLEPIIEKSALICSGMINGNFFPTLVTCDLSEAINGTELIIITTPATAHESLAEDLMKLNLPLAPILLSPGRTLGAYSFEQVFKRKNKKIIVAEAQTVIHTCRDLGDGYVHIFSIKPSVEISGMNKNSTDKVYETIPNELKEHYSVAENWIKTSLGNIGFVLHCSPMLLNTGWIESKVHRFNFYRDGITPRVASLIESIDAERCSIAKKLDTDIFTIHQWLNKMYGTPISDLHSMLQQTAAYQCIDAPWDMSHRYIYEDVPCGLVPTEALAKYFNIETPTISLIIDLACCLLDYDFRLNGRIIPKDIEAL